MDKILNFVGKIPLTTWLVITLFVLGGLGILGFYIFVGKNSLSAKVSQELDITFDPEGPYAILTPRRDGNALNLNLKRTASYDSISYDLIYNADGIDRGVSGDVDTSNRKGEYDQEILFGSCSKSICKYDLGVENGTLSLRIKKGNKLFKMNTQWHLQRVDVALGILTSGDGHFVYKVNGSAQQLGVIGLSIINDLSAVPKLPAGREVFGKVYALNVPTAKILPPGLVSIELADNPPDGAKLFRFDEVNGWKELDTKIENSKLTAIADSAGIFTVLVGSK